MRNLIRQTVRGARLVRSAHAPRFPWITVIALSAGLGGLGIVAFKSRTTGAATAPAATADISQPSLMALGSFAPLLDPGYDLGGNRRAFATAPSIPAGGPSAARVATAPDVLSPDGFVLRGGNHLTLASLPMRDTAIDAPSSTASLGSASRGNATLGGTPSLTAPLPLARPDVARPDAAAAEADGPDTTMVAPLPMRRPADVPAAATPEQPRIATRRGNRQQAASAEPAAQPDGRNFFERLFGARRDGDGPQLAYAPADANTGTDAAPSRGGLGGFGGFNFSLPGLGAPRPPQGIAIYDIGSKMIYLPNGEKLEAQSGLGAYRNDVRYAHVRMRGPTPPHVYDLTEREALFHGVRAIRLNPVGGSRAIHGRAGLLAHTYLMGPSGDSNGCISIKDYDRFLQAFLRGEIRRLIVVRDRTEAVAAVERANVRVSSR